VTGRFLGHSRGRAPDSLAVEDSPPHAEDDVAAAVRAATSSSWWGADAPGPHPVGPVSSSRITGTVVTGARRPGLSTLSPRWWGLVRAA
jgi:hypothetical protein